MNEINFERRVKEAIIDEMRSYAKQIAEELSQKYEEEFTLSLSKKEAEIVARAAESIMLSTREEPSLLQTHIVITMKG